CRHGRHCSGWKEGCYLFRVRGWQVQSGLGRGSIVGFAGIVVILLAVDRTQSLCLEDVGDILEHAAVSAEIDGEIIDRLNLLGYVPRDPPDLSLPPVARAGERREKSELQIVVRQPLKFILVVDILLGAEPPVEADRPL